MASYGKEIYWMLIWRATMATLAILHSSVGFDEMTFLHLNSEWTWWAGQRQWQPWAGRVQVFLNDALKFVSSIDLNKTNMFIVGTRLEDQPAPSPAQVVFTVAAMVPLWYLIRHLLFRFDAGSFSTMMLTVLSCLEVCLGALGWLFGPSTMVFQVHTRLVSASERLRDQSGSWLCINIRLRARFKGLRDSSSEEERNELFEEWSKALEWEKEEVKKLHLMWVKQHNSLSPMDQFLVNGWANVDTLAVSHWHNDRFSVFSSSTTSSLAHGPLSCGCTE